MIQISEGVLMLKGSGAELIADLGAIVFALRKKDFPLEVITSAVASAIVRADDEESDIYMDVVLDREYEDKKDCDNDKSELKKNTESISKDTFKKMFGEFFDE